MTDSSPKTSRLPVMAVRGMVMFPGVTTTMRVGRERSLAALKHAVDGEGRIVLVSQRDAEVEDVSPDDLYDVGVVCLVTTASDWNGGATVALASGVQRCRIAGIRQMDPFIIAEIAAFHETDTDVPNSLRVQVGALLAAGRGADAASALLGTLDPEHVDGAIAFSMGLGVADKQELLAQPSVLTRYQMLVPVLAVEVQVARARQDVREDRRYRVSDEERRQYLLARKKEVEAQLRALADDEDGSEELRVRIEDADLPEEAMREAERELARLSKMDAGSPEYGVATDYLEWLADLPWRPATPVPIDLSEAQRILDRDHYDRYEVKERILEYLAVQSLHPGGRGTALCFVGAPGVGKTSMGRSIADATGRQFYRISLGGVRDEAELRGHRRTYVGALPGAIMRALRTVGASNPVIMLDEVDKLASGIRGDPASVLLEVLDPEQNTSFVDNYIALSFDLSRIMFICTANTEASIPFVLRDRMEMVSLAGYTTEEKVAIARKHLLRKLILANGLGGEQIEVDDDAIRFLIERYTREGGVRNLERRISGLLRKIARGYLDARYEFWHVDGNRIVELLGPPPFDVPAAEKADRPGVCQTLGLSDAGGVLMRVEIQHVGGEGAPVVTGRAGDALRESVTLAHDFWKAHCDILVEPLDVFDQGHFHVHFPAGSVPKEGTSSGLALAVAFASYLCDSIVPEDVAILGEVTLTGKVLGVDGISERLSAAGRAGIGRVIVPERNRADVEHARERRAPLDAEVTYVESVLQAVEVVLPGRLQTNILAKV